MGEKAKKSAAASGGIHEGAARSMLARDSQSSRLLNAGKALGNAEMQKKMGGKAAKRDEMLAFLCSRLSTMRSVQQREISAAMPHEMAKARNQLGDTHKAQFQTPDPNKWKLPAATYEQAAYHLCHGDVHRGQQLLDKAMHEERRCFEQVSAHIDLSAVEFDAGGAVGDAMEGVRPGDTCAECETPEGVEIAAEIEACETVAHDVATPKRVKDPDWGEEEEEEEDNKGTGQAGPAEGGKGA